MRAWGVWVSEGDGEKGAELPTLLIGRRDIAISRKPWWSIRAINGTQRLLLLLESCIPAPCEDRTFGIKRGKER